ncbi:nucleotide exchange factor GrpE [Thermohalobacter berrensis]|uniref:Protein GrpE n=1 Tax=Thermohalobacter berrensis TaxID=99594 RepID=A0A419TBC0_9FIRM|nr:nucleotide exchange factor GrpE [Thermohalobacter berrensis]RKD34747.1 nucleotide exchange factor GrpE [Thermohalobacter berrensis]
MDNVEKNKEIDNIKEKEEADSNLEAIKEELNEDSKEYKEDKTNEIEEKYKKQLKEKEEEIEELNSRFLRLQADFTNYKKRVNREKDSIYINAYEDLITQILPVIDNFERALDAVEEKDKEDSFYQGVKMVYDQFINILKQKGLEEIKSIGEKFDPNLHHGVSSEENDEYEEDTIIEVFQKGYKFKDKVIRPSMVKVSK